MLGFRVMGRVMMAVEVVGVMDILRLDNSLADTRFSDARFEDAGIFKAGLSNAGLMVAWLAKAGCAVTRHRTRLANVGFVVARHRTGLMVTGLRTMLVIGRLRLTVVRAPAPIISIVRHVGGQSVLDTVSFQHGFKVFRKYSWVKP